VRVCVFRPLAVLRSPGLRAADPCRDLRLGWRLVQCRLVVHPACQTMPDRAIINMQHIASNKHQASISSTRRMRVPIGRRTRIRTYTA